MKYPKIETLFKRDDNFAVTTELRLPEFDLVKRWIVTEKIDGTNCRVIYSEGQVEIRGRTDNAQWNPKVLEQLQAIFTLEKFQEVFPTEEAGLDVILYGEAYGPKIQSGGIYRHDVSFRLFDVLIGHWWLNWADVEDIALKIEVNTVPVLGTIDELPYTMSDLSDLIQSSIVARDEKDEEVQAEGIVARTDPLLFTRRGDRVLWKLKFKDFK